MTTLAHPFRLDAAGHAVAGDRRDLVCVRDHRGHEHAAVLCVPHYRYAQDPPTSGKTFPEVMRAVGYGVAAHAASWLLQPPVLYRPSTL